MAIGDQLFHALSGIGQTYVNVSQRNAEAQRQRDAEDRARGYQLEDETRKRGYQDEDYMKNLRRQAARMPGVETATEGEIQAWLLEQGRKDKVSEATALAEAAPGIDLVKRASAAKSFLPEGVTPTTATEEQVRVAEEQKHIADNIPKGERAVAEYHKALAAETAEYNKLAAAAKVDPVVLPGQERIKTLVDATAQDFAAIKNAKTDEERRARVRGFLRTNKELLLPTDRIDTDQIPDAKAMAEATRILKIAASDPESFAKAMLGDSYDKLKAQDVRVMTAYNRDPLSALDRAQLSGYQAAAAARVAAYQKMLSLELPIDYTQGSPQKALEFAYRVADGEFKDPKTYEAARRAAASKFSKVVDPGTGLGHGAGGSNVLDTGDLSPNGKPTTFSDFVQKNPNSPAATGSLSDVAAEPPPPKPTRLDETADPMSKLAVGAAPEEIAAAREQSRALDLRKKLAQQKAEELAAAEAQAQDYFEDLKDPNREEARRAQIMAMSGGMGMSPFSAPMPPAANTTDRYRAALARAEKLREELAILRRGEDLPEEPAPSAPAPTAPFQGGEFYGLSPEERRRKAAEIRSRVAAERAAASQMRLDAGYAGTR